MQCTELARSLVKGTNMSITPRQQIESWISEQIKKDGIPRNEAELDHLTQRTLLAHSEEFRESQYWNAM